MLNLPFANLTCFCSVTASGLCLIGFDAASNSSFTVLDFKGEFLYIVPISYGAYGIVMIMNASFNGMGKPMPAVHISLARMVIIYLPLAYAGNRYFGINGIFVAYAVANIITGILAFAWARSSVPAQCATHEAPVIIG